MTTVSNLEVFYRVTASHLTVGGFPICCHATTVLILENSCRAEASCLIVVHPWIGCRMATIRDWRIFYFVALSRRMPDAGCRMPDAGCRMPDAGRRTPGSARRIDGGMVRQR